MRSRATRISAALVALFASLTIMSPQQAAAAIVDPMRQFYSGAVDGDLNLIGNSVVVCPGNNARCATAAQRGNNATNNEFNMRWSDVDSDSGTFNSSRSQFTIPAATHVVKAELLWGGNTGGNNGCDPGPETEPPGSWTTQKPRLTVGSADSVDVTAEEVTTDTSSRPYYSAETDVTDHFADVDGGATTVTVGNVWVPQGLGCFGGWSLAVVWEYDDATCETARREVFMYEGHIRQSDATPSTVTASDFRMGEGQARVGVVGYEGDWGITGDQFRINNVAQADPQVTGSATNFFLSRADGQIAPNNPNNFSVDAKDFLVDNSVIGTGDTSANLTYSTTGDQYLGQAMMLSVPVAKLCIDKTPDLQTVHSGDTVTFTITVRNPTQAVARNVAVSDPVAPDCDRTIGSLPAGESTTYTCTMTAGSDDYTNTASASGVDANGDTIGDSDTADVRVLRPEIAIEKTAAPETVRQGETVTFTIKVTNTGNAPLSNVSVDDDTTPACDRPALGSLAAGEVTEYTCTTVAGQNDILNTATTSGTDSLGQTVDATDDAAVNVIHPAVAIDKSVDPPTAAPGATVTYTIVVTNTGDVPLTNFSVADPLAPSCVNTRAAALEPGADWTYTCQATVPPGGINTATVTADAPRGAPVTDTDTAIVNVAQPSLTVEKEVNRAAFLPGDDVTFTITVTNTGDIALSAVVVDPSFAQECSRVIPLIEPGADFSYDCTVPAPNDSMTNTVEATGTPIGGGDPTTSTDDVDVRVIHPSVEVVKDGPTDPVHEGDTVTFTITVTNTGDVDLSPVTLSDDQAASCEQPVPDLAPGESHELTCTTTAGADDFTNVVTVTAGVPDDPQDRTVTDDDPADVDVIHPALEIDKSVNPQVVREGDPVHFTITVRNTGDVPITGGAVADSTTPDCSQPLPDPFEVGAEHTYTCDRLAPADDFTNTATVTGDDPTGTPVTATDDAEVDVVHPAINVTKSASPGVVEEGDKVTFTITVENTGDVPLDQVATTDPAYPACDRADLGTLAPGGTTTYTCTTTAGADNIRNTVSASGQPPAGSAVTSRDTAAVDVVHPGISLIKTALPATVAAGGRVTFTITVTNTGDVELQDVEVKDSKAPACGRSGLTLAPGESKQITCTITVTKGLTNTATATGTPVGTCPDDGDVPPGCPTVPFDPVSDTDDATVSVTPGPDPTDPPTPTEPPSPSPTGPTDPTDPSDSGGMPDTGAPNWMLPAGFIGAALLLFGAALMVVQSQRRLRGE